MGHPKDPATDQNPGNRAGQTDPAADLNPGQQQQQGGRASPDQPQDPARKRPQQQG